MGEGVLTHGVCVTVCVCNTEEISCRGEGESGMLVDKGCSVM